MSPELFTLYFNLAFLIIVFSVVYFILTKPFAKRTEDKKEMDAVSRYLLCIGFVLLVFAFIAPHLVFTYLNNTVISSASKEDVDELKSIYDISGPLGDTLGGIMNPFVAMAGVIVTGLAFYMQYKANKAVLEANDELRQQFLEQKRQYQLDKFESQFYEMIRLHKENISEMEIRGYEYIFKEKEPVKEGVTAYDKHLESRMTSGRKVFVTMVTELSAIYLVVKRVFILTYPNKIEENDKIVFTTDNDRKKYFALAYGIFFQGYDSFRESIELFNKKYARDFLEALKEELKLLRSEHRKGEISEDIDDAKRKKNYLYGNSDKILEQYQGKYPKVDLKLYFNYKPFSGHQTRLAHYYRHMFNLVKHVVSQPYDFLSYEEKRKYLKIFRAQLSNHEIVMLYYNWLGGYGRGWEEPGSKRGNRNRFFTDYRILHNLNKTLVMQEFDPTTILGNSFRDFIYKGGNPKSDRLFELYGVESNLTNQENEIRKRL